MNPASLVRRAMQIVPERTILAALIRNDIRARYTGSALGMVWAFVHPLVLVAIYWFVFTVGFRAGEVDGAPFFVWLLAGVVPFLFVQDVLISGSSAIRDSAFLVRKVAFKTGNLILVKIGSAAAIHLFFVLLLMLCAFANGVVSGAALVQIGYYFIASSVLTLGITLVTASLVPFVRDVAQGVAVAVPVLFWATPILWPLQQIPAHHHWWLKLNPFHYIVDGYRDAVIGGRWVWEKPWTETLLFWTVAGVLLTAGLTVFRRLRPHFADAL